MLCASHLDRQFSSFFLIECFSCSLSFPQKRKHLDLCSPAPSLWSVDYSAYSLQSDILLVATEAKPIERMPPSHFPLSATWCNDSLWAGAEMCGRKANSQQSKKEKIQTQHFLTETVELFCARCRLPSTLQTLTTNFPLLPFLFSFLH